jgi:hypothetical protein
MFPKGIVWQVMAAQFFDMSENLLEGKIYLF